MWGGRYIFGEHDVGASAAARFADVEVRGVCVAAKDHAAGTVRDAIVGICSEVIEELEHVSVGILCGRGLLLVELAQGDEELVVDGAGVVADGANELLDA